MNKVAIVIGHRPGRQGAYSPFLKKTEYEFNSEVASYLMDIADVYERPNIPFVGETFRIKQLVKEINKHDYELVISLHFNSFHDERAHGATALYYITNSFGKVIANEFVKTISEHFNIKQRELIPISSTKQRGGTLIKGLKATAILLEPFFGSNESDAKKFLHKTAEYSRIIRDLILVSGYVKQELS